MSEMAIMLSKLNGFPPEQNEGVFDGFLAPYIKRCQSGEEFDKVMKECVDAFWSGNTATKPEELDGLAKRYREEKP